MSCNVAWFYIIYSTFEFLENDKTGYEIIFYKEDTVEEQLQSLPLLEEFEDEITLSPNEDKEKEDENLGKISIIKNSTFCFLST